MKLFVATEDHQGVRLDVALAALLGVSRSQAASQIDEQRVWVDGRIRAKHHRLRPGEEIGVHAAQERQATPAPAVPPVRYDDEHLLIIAKPAGLVVHPGAGHPDGTLVDALRAAGHVLAPAAGETRPGIVHRLDRDTSGLLMIARTDEAYHGLVAALRRRTVRRGYLALVRGVPNVARGRIDAAIGRDLHERTRFAVTRDGKPSVTRYRVLASGTAPALPVERSDVALLACALETGRTHQIRVHLTTLGHPVVGDPTYGPASDVARALELDRPFLHAASLTFPHPVTGETIAVDEHLPETLTNALQCAGVALPADLGIDPTDA